MADPPVSRRSVLTLERALSSEELAHMERLAEQNDSVLLAAFNLYLQDRKWPEFKVGLSAS